MYFWSIPFVDVFQSTHLYQVCLVFLLKPHGNSKKDRKRFPTMPGLWPIQSWGKAEAPSLYHTASAVCGWPHLCSRPASWVCDLYNYMGPYAQKLLVCCPAGVILKFLRLLHLNLCFIRNNGACVWREEIQAMCPLFTATPSSYSLLHAPGAQNSSGLTVCKSSVRLKEHK